MSTLRVNTLQNASGAGQPAMAGAAKAWVNFNGTGTVAIRAGFNVTSITDNGVGLYTVNFTTAMADTNYICVGMSALNDTSSHNRIVGGPYVTPTASAFRLVTSRADTAGIEDQAFVSVSFFD